MTDDVAPAKRPDGCQAIVRTPFATCDRCGLAWDIRRPPAPACAAMTFGRIKARLFNESCQLVDEHDTLARYQAGGTPADPLPPLIRSMELQAIKLLIDKITESDPILDILNPKRRQRGS